ncbi:hypothetical protein [Rhodopseudomonas sp. B29]|uniref:hypothetical protein n=1 Tax=Rhodopseudomonas sp. B29 TaxID=95607 RepID=UPI0003463A24|nr:hypothetical protein [Rhodopseudomonas sp. B29]
MNITERKRGRLRDAWHGAATAAEVARAHGLAVPTLLKFWRLERDAGRLPNATRPHFVKFARPLPAVPAAEAVDDDDTADDFDADAAHRLAVIGSFASVDTMRIVHANLDNDAAQTAPADWLAFDRKGAVPPTHAELMAMARAHDQRSKQQCEAA